MAYMSRRTLLSGLAAAGLARAAPAAPVAIARCPGYGDELLPALKKIFDQIGGLGRIVKGRTVAIKLCLNGNPAWRQGWLQNGDSHWPHPRLIQATLHLMENAGARRIRLLESAPQSLSAPLEEHMLAANWEPAGFTSAAKNVEFENTNALGNGRKYSRITVPNGGFVFPAYDVNHSYEDCDVFVSFGKVKDHPTAGVTLGIKNVFGITPSAVYSSRMTVFHNGRKQPLEGAPPEKDPKSPRDDGYRIPRIIAELVAARPVHLSLLDGIKTIAGAQRPETYTTPVNPGFLVTGANVVNVDAIAMALMNYDPMADRGSAPFETCDNTLRIAEELGVGTRDPRRIELAGARIREAMFDFKALRERSEVIRRKINPKGLVKT